MEIIDRILLLLKEKNKTQADLCEHLNVNPSVFSTWKKRGTIPPSKYIIRICEYLGVSFTYLMYGENEPKPSNENNNICARDVTNSKIVNGHDNSVTYGADFFSHRNIYYELISYLEALSVSKRRHALADLMDVLEEKYPIN